MKRKKTDTGIDRKVDQILDNVRIYRGNPKLKRAGEKICFEPWMIDEIRKCKEDPVYFANTYIKIISIDKGLIPLRLYDFQEEIIRTITNNRNTCALSSRQSGKSTCVSAWLLWFIIFHSSKHCALLSNKSATSRQLLSRIRLAYMELPKWLQIGVNDGGWAKGHIELENNSSIIACSAASDAVRGSSLAFCYIDEAAWISNFEEFWKSTYPTISSGVESKICMISTPNGENFFWEQWKKAEAGESSFVPIKVTWDRVPGRDSLWAKRTLADVGELAFRQEYNLEALSIDNSLLGIQGTIQLRKTKKEPSELNKHLRIYEHPDSSRKYFASVDCADLGTDASAISIIDITDDVYKQVAVYRNPDISHMEFPSVIVMLCSRYNMCPVLIESNDIGSTILRICQHELEYDSVIMTTSPKKFRDSVPKLQLGLRQTQSTKRIGCQTLKTLVESGKLEIYDSWTQDELKNFIQDGSSYSAAKGHHDDLVMTLVTFAYYSETQSFRRQFPTNVQDGIKREMSIHAYEDLGPLPVFANMVGPVDSEDLSWLYK